MAESKAAPERRKRLAKPVRSAGGPGFLAVLWIGGSAFTVPAPSQIPVPAPSEEALWVATPDFAIGGHTLDPAHQFGQIRDLALFRDHRFVVSDRLVRRVAVFGEDGRFVTSVGSPGGGPGEFRSFPRSVAVSPNNEIWVEAPYGYLVFSPVSQGWAYDRTIRAGPRRQVRGKPIFARDDVVGLRVPGAHGEVVWVGGGEIVREDTLPRIAPWDELGHGEFFATLRDGRRIRQEVPGPYPAKDLLRSGRTGGYARAVTSRYQIELLDDDGGRIATISRQIRGPVLSVAERRREERLLDSLTTFYGRRGWRYPEFQVPERKPPIEDLWFDEEDRLWVQLSLAEGDALANAHVYTKEGDFLFAAAWPRDVSLEYGAIRGRVAVGVRTDDLDVPEIVRMTFVLRPPPGDGRSRGQPAPLYEDRAVGGGRRVELGGCSLPQSPG